MLNRRSFFAAALGAPSLFAERAGADVPRAAATIPAFPDDADPAFWERVRDQFYITPGEVYSNTAALGAVPRPVLERVIEHMRTLQLTITRWDLSPRTPMWISGYSPELPLREKMGRLVNADPLDIAITQNATFGMNFLAQGLDLKAGDEVVQTDQEHSGGKCGWQMRVKRDGIVWKQVKIPVPANDPDELMRLFQEALTSRTRVLAFPHIISGTGVLLPVKRLTALAHERGCLAIIDGAQAVGQVEVDLKSIDCDAYFSSPHKWLLAPAGNGMLYIRRDRQQMFWTTLCSGRWDDQKDGMFRFMQYGTGNPSLQVGLDAALDFHFRLGPERVRKRIRSLADRLRAGLQQISGVKINSPVHPELVCAAVVYAVAGVPAQDLEEELWVRKRIRTLNADPFGVRHACGIYNNEAEIDATLEAVRALARKA
jgi:selenocysteine lyase/cysteine desulfurase